MQATIAGIRYDTERATLIGRIDDATLYTSPRATNCFLLEDQPSRPGTTGIKPIDKGLAVSLTLSHLGRARAIEVFGADVVRRHIDDDLRAESAAALESLDRIRDALVALVSDIDAIRRDLGDRIAAAEPDSDH